MAERRTSYGLPDLLASGHGDLLGPGRAQLPLPPLLMFERIEAISDTGGTRGRGHVVATLDIAGNPSVDWFFSCHFRGDPVMPGSLGLEALWQLTGFYLGWLGEPGKGRALGVREVKLTGLVTPRIARIEYVVDIKRVVLRRLKLAIADGTVKADGEVVCTAMNLTVGLAEIGAPGSAPRMSQVGRAS
jgi:3-hydroxyacyl-[acyl-carrier protein] dehydratase/trans-2-decenoyl-[acyl-carrier protein] isomerase